MTTKLTPDTAAIEAMLSKLLRESVRDDHRHNIRAIQQGLARLKEENARLGAERDKLEAECSRLTEKLLSGGEELRRRAAQIAALRDIVMWLRVDAYQFGKCRICGGDYLSQHKPLSVGTCLIEQAERVLAETAHD